MKRKTVWGISPSMVLLFVLPFLLLAVTFFLNRYVFLAELTVLLPVVGYLYWRFRHRQEDLRRYLKQAVSRLDFHDRQALGGIPLPVVLLSTEDELIWYNDAFLQQVLDGQDAIGRSLSAVFPNLTVRQAGKTYLPSVVSGSRSFAIYTVGIKDRQFPLRLLFCVDNTELTRIAEEYTATRPAVLSLYIDNSEEIFQNVRDSERAQISSQVETLLEDWVGFTSGIFRKTGTDRFVAVIEQRHLQQMIHDKFDILDKVRAVPTGKTLTMTLSVGVGTGKTLADAETASRQALDMALGRGGDQAAVKTPSGFDFFGGLSKSVEKQTKVRTRVVASALRDMILSSDMVLTMGHRYSDLDCMGSSVALAAACRSLGKPAFTVYDPKTTLAGKLVERYNRNNQLNADIFVEEERALLMMTRETLLIICDTHRPAMLDRPELYRMAENTVVIDHHRKMVEHIDDAVIFYHEPYSSSASEMVSELIQYMPGAHITASEAEALLAGIMLDTRSFVMKAGVRTFEAAAYLRKCGADTVRVKQLFAESLETYQNKATIVSTAEWYRNTVIAYALTSGTDTRIAAAQAADELLTVQGTDASFTLFSENGGINISARSFGTFNVQLVMEALGGGGHQSMAGAFLENTDMPTAIIKIKQAVDAHRDMLERSKAVQQQTKL